MDHFDSFGISSGTCSAFSPEQFNQQFSSSNRKLFIMNFNIRSFNANIGEFSLFLDELVRIPDIIILTETWNSDDLSAEIDKYRSYHCNRPNNRRGGGVSIYVNNSLKAKSARISMANLPEIEYIHVKLTLNLSSIDIIAVIILQIQICIIHVLNILII